MKRRVGNLPGQFVPHLKTFHTSFWRMKYPMSTSIYNLLFIKTLLLDEMDLNAIVRPRDYSMSGS